MRTKEVYENRIQRPNSGERRQEGEKPLELRTAYVNAGTNYGVGHNQPVGKFKASGYGVPTGRVNTMKTDYVNKGRPNHVEVPEK
jgi:acyl-CoA reductase-like NAD-dependent aldehyde dehydrogenase